MVTRRGVIAGIVGFFALSSSGFADDLTKIYQNGSGMSIAIFQMDGHSMVPTILSKEFVLVDPAAYVKSRPQRGDVVLFQPPTASDKPYVKRVVAVEGDEVGIHHGAVWIDGKSLDERYVNPGVTSCSSICDWLVPNGSVFVLGDNRTNSSDSRVFGPVDNTAILGRVFFALEAGGRSI
jgi:signal peptidase I